MLTPHRKQEIVEQYGRHEKDSGSSETQIAQLTERIRTLTEHLRANPRDHDSQRGLFRLVGRRRRLMGYLRRKDPESYQALIQRLGIRG